MKNEKLNNLWKIRKDITEKWKDLELKADSPIWEEKLDMIRADLGFTESQYIPKGHIEMIIANPRYDRIELAIASRRHRRALLSLALKRINASINEMEQEIIIDLITEAKTALK
jgi:hypothetical protein